MKVCLLTSLTVTMQFFICYTNHLSHSNVLLRSNHVTLSKVVDESQVKYDPNDVACSVNTAYIPTVVLSKLNSYSTDACYK